MIPKVINYCWFGNKEKPNEVKKCIDSWKKNCPDYKIVEWNESNYDVKKNTYVKYTYENKKWAFLTDYVRLDVIYENGGIYLDTDVELLKPLDDLLDCKGYIGMEQVGTINTGQGFAAEKNHPFIKENKEFYENYNPCKENGEFNKIICVQVTTDILKKNGLKVKNEIQKICDMIIYPVEYFCPKVMGTNKIRITDKTYSIHHFDCTWKSQNRIVRKIGYYLIPLKQLIKKIVGER